MVGPGIARRRTPSVPCSLIYAIGAAAAILLMQLSPGWSELGRKPGSPVDRARREAFETMPFRPHISQRVGHFRTRA